MRSHELKRAKRDVRRAILARRDAMPSDERAAAEEAIASRFLELPELSGARTAMSFWSFGSEVSTVPILEGLRARGIRTALPRIVEGALEVRTYRPGDRVRATSFGAMEPADGAAIPPEDIDVICTPSVAFDRRGGRVGYGGGFYDAFFPLTREDAHRIGVAFALQVLEDRSAGRARRPPRGHHRDGARDDPLPGRPAVSNLPAAPLRPRRRTPWADAEYAALDFETTGLDYAQDHIVSFGVVPVLHGRVLLGGAVHQLVRPATPPSRRSQTVHLLRPADLQEAPPIEDAREQLRDLLARRYLLVWFADVEVHFLARTFGGSLRAWRRRTIDVRNLAIAAAGEPADVRRRQGFALHTAARRYGVPVTSPHDALDDALVTAQLLLVLVSKLPGIAAPTVRDLVAIAR